MSWIEEVKEILREQLKVDKVRVIEPRGLEDCYLFVTESGDDIFLIGVWKGDRAFYAKIMPAASAPTSWDCRSLEYAPVGLYAFAETPRELADRIAEKFPVAVNISRNIHLTVA